MRDKTILVIIELFLCSVDSFSLIRHIKKINKDMPIIVLGFWATKEEIEERYKWGCNYLISKPNRIKDIIHFTEKALNNRVGNKKISHET